MKYTRSASNKYHKKKDYTKVLESMTVVVNCETKCNDDKTEKKEYRESDSRTYVYSTKEYVYLKSNALTQILKSISSKIVLKNRISHASTLHKHYYTPFKNYHGF